MEHYFLIGMGLFCIVAIFNSLLHNKHKDRFDKFYNSVGFDSYKRYRKGIFIVTVLLLLSAFPEFLLFALLALVVLAFPFSLSLMSVLPFFVALLIYLSDYILFPSRPRSVIIMDIGLFWVISDIFLIHLLFITKSQILDIDKNFFWKIIISRYSFYLSFIGLYFSFAFYRPSL